MSKLQVSPSIQLFPPCVLGSYIIRRMHNKVICALAMTENQNPEQKARDTIDALLRQAGWKPTSMADYTDLQVAVIGGGPAGLMAAEVLSLSGVQVDVYDAMPSPGRKFLLAGIGGLNITHSEPYDTFCTRYGDRQPQLQPLLDRLPPSALRSWIHELGIDTFVGSSGRVFPTKMKSAPLLRAWLHRLRSAGVRLHVRYRWLGWNDDGSLRLANPGGEIAINPQATVLALGGPAGRNLDRMELGCIGCRPAG